MDAATQPEKGGYTPELWSDMAAVSRTVEWHSVEPKRVLQAKFMGATCVRLLKRCLANEGVPEETRTSLDQIMTIMTGFDELEPEDRVAQLARAQARRHPFARGAVRGAQRGDGGAEVGGVGLGEPGARAPHEQDGDPAGQG